MIPNRTKEEEALIDELYRCKAQYHPYAAYCTTTGPMILRKWDGIRRDAKGEAIEIEEVIPAGTTLKIVMVSRLDDFGVTDDLTATHGYHCRLFWDTMTVKDIRREP